MLTQEQQIIIISSNLCRCHKHLNQIQAITLRFDEHLNFAKFKFHFQTTLDFHHPS